MTVSRVLQIVNHVLQVSSLVLHSEIDVLQTDIDVLRGRKLKFLQVIYHTLSFNSRNIS